MSWLRGSPLASSFTKQRSRDSPPKDADPVACYDSFREHWQQSHNIIAHSTPPKNKPPSQDDVLGVVNHVDQMINLLQLEMRDFSNVQQRLQIQRMQQKNMVATAQLTAHHTPCLEHLLSENLLDKLFDWSEHTGRYGAAVRVEQLKLYELLISHDSSLLTHEPVTRPLLHLLDGCAGDTILPEVQKKLITLLNYICVALVQNTELLGLFFRPTATGKNRFIVFSLLVSYIHKEGSLGQQARDAMLHCMSLSKTNEEIGNYIAEESHICSVLAMGLSGLYSLLPRTLDIENEDWHRLTVDDVNDIPALTQLMNSLDFCNAVAQVVHPSVQKQLMEFLYKGFLIPVIGPALLQESVGLTLDELDSMIYRTSVEELIAATAYFDLFLRSVTEPGLLGLILKFLLEEYYDENRIFDHLIQRISSQGSRLSLVTLALFETLVDLNCEDVMLELCLGALAPCSHVMLSQRRRLLRDLDPFGRCAERFLALTPSCCSSSTVPTAILAATAGVSPIASPDLRRQNIATVSIAQQQQQQQQQQQSATNANALKNTSLAFRSLYSNYYAYLRDARQKIAACQIACSTWSRKYEDEEEDTLGVEVIDPDDTDNENGNFDECYEDDSLAFDLSPDKEVERKNSTDEKVNRIIASFSPKPIKTQKLQVTGRVRADSVEDITKRLTREEREKLEADIAELLSESCSSTPSAKSPSDDSTAALNSLSLSGGESSGYESFACSNNNANNGKSLSPLSNELSIGSTSSQKPVLIHQRRRRLQRRDAKDARLESIDAKPPSVGIFFDVVLKKLENMMENNVYVNLHLTGLMGRLAIYPQPLLQSFLLNHTLVFQPSIKSLFQILASLKHRIDAFIAKQSEGNISSLVEQARVFLITRENRLVNIRKNVLEAAAQCPSPRKNQPSNESAYSNVNWAGKASEPRKKSLTSSLTQMFRKTSNTESNSSTDSYNNNHNASSLTLENENRNGNVKYIKHVNSWETPNKISRLQNVILCAVILDEWLKELAAITQEHTIISWFCAASVSDGPQNEDLD